MRPSHLLAAAPVAALGLLAGTAPGWAAGTSSSTGTTSILSTTTQKLVGTTTLKPGTATTSPTSGTSTSGTTPTSLTGSASSQVISIDPLQTCVSCTSAQAGSGSTSGQATALEIFGTTVEGGGSKDNGKDSGALIAVPANPLVTAAVLDWAAMSSAAGSTNSSHSRAAVADVALAGGQVATVTVLEADSSASWTGSSSSATATGHSENNGAVVNLGQGALVLVLLHSDADSNGSSNAYVASINGNQILSSGQTGGIPIDIPGVGTITLLSANASGGTAAASVGTVSNLLGQTGTQGTLFGSTGSGAKTSSGVQAANTGQPTVVPNNGGSATTASTGNGVHTPFTGAGIALGGLALLGAGGVAFGGGVLMRRRRRGQVA
jgi:hypothetical protein